ncbi:mechanosensitive ion channel family protein [Ideonella sp. YS5]|uniref:mechanosensitive ion channel family protein n=1 Tax=Ideonella sp. YS5 TaxID=3453714 RepID=UPI003EE9A208
MDLTALRTHLDMWDIRLFMLGQAEITVSSLFKLAIWTWLLLMVAGRLSRYTLGKLLSRTQMIEGQRLAVIGLVHYTVLVVGAMLILQNAGINLTAFAVVASALGVGVGFGLQNIISNFISGLIIMLERPIQVGDRIEIAGVEGLVHSIGARRTTIVTADSTTILVPNQRFITDNVTNYVFLDREVRLRVPVTVAQGSDVRLVEKLLVEAAHVADVHAEPKPQVALTSLGGAAIGLELWVWYDGQQFARQEVLSRLYFSISDALKLHDIKVA